MLIINLHADDYIYLVVQIYKISIFWITELTLGLLIRMHFLAESKYGNDLLSAFNSCVGDRGLLCLD